MTITIQPVTKNNIRNCVKLEVSQDQKDFVARNIATIAWAYVDDTFTPYAISHEETVVGLAAVEYIPENDLEDKHWIPRFMIGEEFQGMGYGKKAMQALIDMISKYEDCERIRLSVVPENKGAIEFYQKIGFLMTEEMIEDELVMEYLVKGGKEVTRNHVKIGLYVLAVIITFFLIFIPLSSDYTINNRLLVKALIGLPLFLVIIGKLITVKEKKDNHVRFDKDIYIMIGLLLGSVLYFFS